MPAPTCLLARRLIEDSYVDAREMPLEVIDQVRDLLQQFGFTFYYLPGTRGGADMYCLCSIGPTIDLSQVTTAKELKSEWRKFVSYQLGQQWFKVLSSMIQDAPNCVYHETSFKDSSMLDALVKRRYVMEVDRYI